MYIQFYSFLSAVYVFYFFSNLIIIRLARISTMLHTSDRSRHPYFVPNLRANALSLSPSNIMLAIGLFFLFFFFFFSIADNAYFGENIFSYVLFTMRCFFFFLYQISVEYYLIALML